MTSYEGPDAERKRLRLEVERLHDEVDRLRDGALDLARRWRDRSVGVSTFLPGSAAALQRCADELDDAMSIEASP